LTSQSANRVILLVEDNEDDVFLTEMAFAKAGCKNSLRVVTDGDEAVEYLAGDGKFADRETHPFPSLILLDLKLPYRSGLEILSWMRSNEMLGKATVAVLTSSNEPNDLKRAYELGTNTYLVKPPTPQTIHDIKRAFKLDWLSCDKLPSD
jgi:CheY-like chemotaxis protein